MQASRWASEPEEATNAVSLLRGLVRSSFRCALCAPPKRGRASGLWSAATPARRESAGIWPLCYEPSPLIIAQPASLFPRLRLERAGRLSSREISALTRGIALGLTCRAFFSSPPRYRLQAALRRPHPHSLPAPPIAQPQCLLAPRQQRKQTPSPPQR
ncbi:hypothetical protein BDY21DRAFT_354931 [Lineolata rhizophorae]|uniref:Uncharacterized protein n=1 Tax=Lineolata rhizophorae TaxID=578093 RepID=A0A6A6NQQ3_9PEZI|nr:hypothetical protein BDY21DRAFT_354931 [Lineolata rhizophorae]